MPKKTQESSVVEDQAVKVNSTDLLLQQVVESLKSVTTGLNELKDAIAKPVTSNLPDGLLETRKIETASQVPQESYPIPADYRSVVDSVLNKSFGIELEPHTDAPVTTVTITVPDKYSNMPAPQRELMKSDRRPKVINHAEGANGLREWCELIFKNLGPEMQALITADRINAN